LQQLGAIKDMRLGGEGAVLGALAIGLTKADCRPQMIDRTIKYDDVIGHVHMAVVVDPLGTHDGSVAGERGGNSAPSIKHQALRVVVEPAGVETAATATKRIATALVKAATLVVVAGLLGEAIAAEASAVVIALRITASGEGVRCRIAGIGRKACCRISARAVEGSGR